jgi:hypothetical protein
MSRSFRFLAVFGFVLLGAPVVPAQSFLAVRSNIPFAFKAGRALLPTGEYLVQHDDAEMYGVLRVRSEDGQQSAFVLVSNAGLPKGADEPRLLFDKQGGETYVLTEVVGLTGDHALQVVGTRPAPEGERVATAATAY